MIRVLAALALAWAILGQQAMAIAPWEMLKDPALEQRARDLGKELRCPKCQNQSLDDSEAGIAVDLRRIVRERLVAGDTDEQVKAYLVQRYGSFVLLEPPVKETTWILWFGPFVVVAIGALAIWRIASKNRARLANAPADDDDDDDFDEQESRRS